MERALEELVCADEELRARVAARAAEAKARVESAKVAAAQRQRERLQRGEERLAAELRRLREETLQAIAARQAQRAQWLAKREAEARAALQRGAEVWARIVRDGP